MNKEKINRLHPGQKKTRRVIQKHKWLQSQGKGAVKKIYKSEHFTSNQVLFKGGGGVPSDIDHTRKRNKVRPSDGHISTTKKDSKILWRNPLPLLS